MQRGTDTRTKKVFETICYWGLSLRAFGTLKVNASGTCSSIQEAFSPSNANHQITYSFIPNSQTVTDVKANLEYKQIPPDNSSEGKIYRLFALNEDASECEDLNIKAGKAFRLRGRNLNFDIKDENQGVFVENEDGITRPNSYNRRGSNNVDAVIPPSLSAGSYSVNKALIRGSIYKSREGYLSRFCSYSGKTLYIRRELAKLLRSTCSFKI